MDNLKTLTVEEISRETGIGERKIKSLIKTGFIRRAPIPGRRIYVYRVDLVNALRPQHTSSDIYDNN